MPSKKVAVQAARYHGDIIVCIARSKCLTYGHLLTNIALALLGFILSVLEGQVSVINESNIDEWEETCVSESLLISFLTPFRFTVEGDSGEVMACPWPVTNIVLRLISVCLIFITNGFIFSLIWKYAEHDCMWKLSRYMILLLTALMFSVFILDSHQLRIGDSFCENKGEIDSQQVLPGGVSVGECEMFEYYLVIFVDVALSITNGAMYLVMNLFLRVKKPKKKSSSKNLHKAKEVSPGPAQPVAPAGGAGPASGVVAVPPNQGPPMQPMGGPMGPPMHQMPPQEYYGPPPVQSYGPPAGGGGYGGPPSPYGGSSAGFYEGGPPPQSDYNGGPPPPQVHMNVWGS